VFEISYGDGLGIFDSYKMHLVGQKLQQYRVILGSASPRRKELLAGLDIPFDVIVKNATETIDQSLSLEYIPEHIAEQKFTAFLSDLQEKDFLITSDTLVFCEDKALGKPKSAEEAKQMVQFLSGKTHSVVTGVCIGTKRKHLLFHDIAKVTFAQIAESDIDYYIEKYKPFDKTGSYGVQEWIGYMGIEKLEGSFYTVMGLPVQMLYNKILEYEE